MHCQRSGVELQKETSLQNKNPEQAASHELGPAVEEDGDLGSATLGLLLELDEDVDQITKAHQSRKELRQEGIISTAGLDINRIFDPSPSQQQSQSAPSASSLDGSQISNVCPLQEPMQEQRVSLPGRLNFSQLLDTSPEGEQRQQANASLARSSRQVSNTSPKASEPRNEDQLPMAQCLDRGQGLKSSPARLSRQEGTSTQAFEVHRQRPLSSVVAAHQLDTYDLMDYSMSPKFDQSQRLETLNGWRETAHDASMAKISQPKVESADWAFWGAVAVHSDHVALKRIANGDKIYTTNSQIPGRQLEQERLIPDSGKVEPVSYADAEMPTEHCPSTPKGKNHGSIASFDDCSKGVSDREPSCLLSSLISSSQVDLCTKTLHHAEIICSPASQTELPKLKRCEGLSRSEASATEPPSRSCETYYHGHSLALNSPERQVDRELQGGCKSVLSDVEPQTIPYDPLHTVGSDLADDSRTARSPERCKPAALAADPQTLPYDPYCAKDCSGFHNPNRGEAALSHSEPKTISYDPHFESDSCRIGGPLGEDKLETQVRPKSLAFVNEPQTLPYDPNLAGDFCCPGKPGGQILSDLQGESQSVSGGSAFEPQTVPYQACHAVDSCSNECSVGGQSNWDLQEGSKSGGSAVEPQTLPYDPHSTGEFGGPATLVQKAALFIGWSKQQDKSKSAKPTAEPKAIPHDPHDRATSGCPLTQERALRKEIFIDDSQAQTLQYGPHVMDTSCASSSLRQPHTKQQGRSNSDVFTSPSHQVGRGPGPSSKTPQKRKALGGTNATNRHPKSTQFSARCNEVKLESPNEVAWIPSVKRRKAQEAASASVVQKATPVARERETAAKRSQKQVMTPLKDSTNIVKQDKSKAQQPPRATDQFPTKQLTLTKFWIKK